MTIIPFTDKIYIKIEKPVAGSLDLSSKPTAVEHGEVVALGEGTEGTLKVGDKIFVKAWALDVITYNKETYYFVDINSKGILAILND